MKPLGPIKYLTFHCSGSPAGRGDTVSIVKQWDIDRPDLRQIAYHWIVPEEGPAVRTLPDTVLGAHVGLHNTGNIGVCYIGGVRSGGDPNRARDLIDTRTTSQKAELQKLAAKYRIVVPGIIVRGHRDWPGVAKACPCFDVKTQL